MSRGIRFVSKSKTRLTLAGALVIALAATVGALAYYTSAGTGTGSASVGTLGAPTNVSTIYSSGSSTVVVSWNAPSGLAPTGYYVTRFDGTNTAPACASSASTPLPPSPTSCSDTGLANGTYTYTVVAVFNSWTAVSAPSSSVSVTSDATPPTSTLTFPATGPYNAAGWNASPGCPAESICGTAQDNPGGSGVQDVQVSVRQGSGNYWNGSAFGSPTRFWNVASGTTSWSLAFPASDFPADGTYTVTVSAVDVDGNVETTTSPSDVFTYDTTPPTVTLTNVNGSPVTFPHSSSTTVTSIGGACATSVSNGATGVVSWSVTGSVTEVGTANCTGGGLWSASLSPQALGSGSYALSATEGDAAGNTGSSGSQALNVTTSVGPYSTPGTYTVVVPAGVTSVPFTLAGGGGGSTGTSTGGSGGSITGTITLPSNPTGTELKVLVAGGGTSGGTGGSAGYAAGGAGGSSSAAGGGGASAIETATGTPIVVAGGGGGAGQLDSGHAGGFGGGAGVPASPFTSLANTGATGGTGASSGGAGGSGGTTSAGGAAGGPAVGSPGGTGFVASVGGGGGGGFDGGSGGASCGAFCSGGGGGGGGGSSYTGWRHRLWRLGHEHIYG